MAQIGFVNPIGRLFLEHGISVHERSPSQEAADVFKALLVNGLDLVEARGVIQRHQRKALRLNTKYSKLPNPDTTTITYSSDDDFERRVAQVGTRTTLNGKLKVLREAIVEVLEAEEIQIDYS